MQSPSNSGSLAKVGDVVTLERNPADDCVGVQAYGDGEGVELIFEGALGHGLVPLKANAGAEAMPVAPDGRFVYLIEALGMSCVQVRLGAILAGSVQVALFSGKADVMKVAAVKGPDKGADPKPIKLPRAAVPTPAPGWHGFESNGYFYAIDNVTGQSSEAFKTAKERDAYIATQLRTQPKTWPGPYKTVDSAPGQFVVVDAAGVKSDPFKTRAEADAWIASNPAPKK